MFWRRASPVVCSGLLFGPPSFFRRGRRRDWRIRSDVFGNEVRVFSGPAACAFDSDDDCVVEEPVEVGRRDDGGSEDVAPLCEASVRGEDHRAFFATRICDLEEQARAALRDGQATGFIDDEDHGPREEADFFRRADLLARLWRGFRRVRQGSSCRRSFRL